MKKYGLILILILCSDLIYCQIDKELHADKIISNILELKQEFLNKDSDNSFIFLSFWDFDGTILKGDSSEGMIENGKTIYKGLAQIAIESGNSKMYRAVGGTKSFFEDYDELNAIGKWIGYPFVVQMLKGSKVGIIEDLSKNYFDKVLKQYYFRSSIKMIKALEKNGIICQIVSASPEIFIKGAAKSMDLPKDRFNGIKVKIEKDRLTEKIIYPVTWAKGKVEKVASIVDELAKENPNKKVVILAAFGNSYGTDGDFLKFVAAQKIGTEKPISVMINGGEAPEKYRGLFITVKQTETVDANN